MKDWKKEILTIPNLLSLFRIALIPVYVHIYINAVTPVDYFATAAVLMLSCLTDLIDGKIARRYNMISTVGKVLDPVADKATQFCLLVIFSIEYPILWTLSSLFVLKESFQLVAMIVAYCHGKVLKGALMSGKICTTVLFFSLIIMVLFHNDLQLATVRAITCVDGIFMLIALVDYIFAYFKNTDMIEDLHHGT